MIKNYYSKQRKATPNLCKSVFKSLFIIQKVFSHNTLVSQGNPYVLFNPQFNIGMIRRTVPKLLFSILVLNAENTAPLVKHLDFNLTTFTRPYNRLYVDNNFKMRKGKGKTHINSC